jgi:hypothetical protein
MFGLEFHFPKTSPTLNRLYHSTISSSTVRVSICSSRIAPQRISHLPHSRALQSKKVFKRQWLGPESNGVPCLKVMRNVTHYAVQTWTLHCRADASLLMRCPSPQYPLLYKTIPWHLSLASGHAEVELTSPNLQDQDTETLNTPAKKSSKRRVVNGSAPSRTGYPACKSPNNYRTLILGGCGPSTTEPTFGCPVDSS